MKYQSLLAAIGALVITTVAAAAPQAQNVGGVRSLSGGAGQEEQRQLQDAAAHYSLGLTFATREGAYVADVDVLVKDRRGHVVFDATALGPIVLVDLPAGAYTVEATYRGQTQRRQVTLSDGRSRALTMQWPDDRPRRG